MVSPWLLLIPAGVAVVHAATKPSAPPAPPKPEIAPGVPDTPKTRAYVEAVGAVESVRTKGGSKVVFNGVSGWMAERTGRPMYPILSEKDLPAAPPGYHWTDTSERSDASRSAHSVHHWHLGTPPKGDVSVRALPGGFPTFWKAESGPPPAPPAGYYWSRGRVHWVLTPRLTQAPVAPPPVPIGGAILDTPKTRAYQFALLLKAQAEAQARGMSVAAVAYTVPAEVLSERELPTASQGFRWATGGMLGPTWRYIRTSEPLAPAFDPLTAVR